MARKLSLPTRAARAEHRQRLTERREKNQREEALLVDRLREASPELEQDFDVVVIPSGFPAQSVPEDERIREYTAHLRDIIRHADDEPDPAEVKSHRKMLERMETKEAQFAEAPELRTLSYRMCAQCKGGCCTAGGNAAFLSRGTIRDVKKWRPDWSDDDILQAYLSRLPTETITNACINQSPGGCVLPREMRSHTCNGFFCEPLVNWQAQPAAERASRVLVIQRSEPYWDRNKLELSNHIVDAALIDAETTLPLNVNPDP